MNQIHPTAVVQEGVILGDDITLGEGVVIESGAIIRDHVKIAAGSHIGSQCILGEHLQEYYKTGTDAAAPLVIGPHALIRSGSILYGNSVIGDHFQTGHRVTIREKSRIGSHVSVGTLGDIQGNCRIGDYVRLHSNVHVGQLSNIENFVWIFPYTVLTNDPTPPSENFSGVHIKSFAVIATGALLMPGVEIGQDALVGAGTIVTKDVKDYAVVVGNPGRVVSDVRNLKNKVTGEPAYPWRYHFKRAMPWSESDFLTWYQSLDVEQKEQYRFEKPESRKLAQ